MKLLFSDGMKFDTSGPLRIEYRSDGMYVVGEGKLMPVADDADAKRVLAWLSTLKVELQ